MTPTTLTDIRNLVYALITVAGLFWMGSWYLHWRRTRSTMAMWATVAAGSMVVFAASGCLSVILAHWYGFGTLTSSVFTFGVVQFGLTVLAGALHIGWKVWQSGGVNGANS